MADIEGQFTYFILFFINFVIPALSDQQVIEYSEDRKPCTYFEDVRYARMELGLVNCSWYVSQSCCKRTEVTSVFSSNMLSLYHASKDCQNRINYMMCYFCSPEQHSWYKGGKVHICEDFCTSTHKACADANFNGTSLGEVYKNGSAFCETQNFKVVNTKYCFKYDSTVFDGAGTTTTTILIQTAMLCLLLLILISQY